VLHLHCSIPLLDPDAGAVGGGSVWLLQSRLRVEVDER
jgi:hypothetical protein